MPLWRLACSLSGGWGSRCEDTPSSHDHLPLCFRDWAQKSEGKLGQWTASAQLQKYGYVQGGEIHEGKGKEKGNTLRNLLLRQALMLVGLTRKICKVGVVNRLFAFRGGVGVQ